MLRPLALLALLAALLVPAQAQQNITWETLARVRIAQQNGRYVPLFEPTVQRLDNQRIAIRGFMIPIEQGAKQSNFLLTPFPLADCFYCIPGGPESMIEVRTERPLDFTYEPITLTGQFDVLSQDPNGLFYRMTGARIQG